MAESDDWKARLKDEHRELSERLSRLDSGIEHLVFDITMERLSRLGESDSESDDESALSQQIKLMNIQRGIMAAYLHILEERARLAGIEL